MTESEIYETMETDASFDALKILAEELPEPLILMGGWAVHYTVNMNYQEAHSSPYLGSRDVDLGFHIDVDASLEQLKQCHFARTLEILMDVGYHRSGTSRFCRYIDKKTGKTLSEKDAANVPTYDLFYLYVDPMVDRIHTHNDEIFKIKPIDEPLLAEAIEKKKMREIKIGDNTLLIPQPEVLLAMKMSSFPNRTKDDKKVKDACDIYALIWYSERSAREIVGKFIMEHPELLVGSREHFLEDIIEKASYHLGIEPEEYNGVISLLFGS